MKNGLTHDEINNIEKFINSMEDLDPEFNQIVTDNFDKLLSK